MSVVGRFGRRSCRRRYSAYGVAFDWGDGAALEAGAGPPIDEVVQADDLVRQRVHLGVDGQVESRLNRACDIVRPLRMPALMASIVERAAFAYQQRGQFKDESDRLGTIDEVGHPSIQAARHLANHRGSCPPAGELNLEGARTAAVRAVIANDPTGLLDAGRGASDDVQGAVRLVTGWIMMERDPLGAEPILAEARSALEPGKSPLLVAATQLLGAAQGTDPAAQQTLKDALSASEAAGLPDHDVLNVESLRLLAAFYKHAGEAILSEGLLRSAISKLANFPFLSAAESMALRAARETYADLLKHMEWNGRSREPDARRVMQASDADSARSPLFTWDPSRRWIPEWLAQYLTAATPPT